VTVAASLYLGTSSFTASGWSGSFYPKRLRSQDQLAYYAQHFSTVEIDSAFYACPAAQTVRQWNERTPDGFSFALKAPQVITHEKVLLGCERELAEFLEIAGLLGSKLAPSFFNSRSLRRLYSRIATPSSTGWSPFSKLFLTATGLLSRFATGLGWTPSSPDCSARTGPPSCCSTSPA